MFNIPFIQIPFGYVLDWLYEFTTNYGLALILFSLLVKLVLLPMNVKSKKSMLKMARVAPLAAALKEKYGDDQVKYQQEVNKLYQEEGVSATGGCLWSLIPLFILLPLYNVIRDPITYMMHIPAETSQQIVTFIQEELGVVLGGSAHYHNMVAVPYVGQFMEQIAANFADVADKLKTISFSLAGLDLSAIPQFKLAFWTLNGWQEIGLFLLPLLSGGANILSMFINQKMNGSVSTNANGEQDEAAQKNQSMGMMMWMMPLISVWIGYSMPAAITVYWIAQSVFGMALDAVITVYCRKSYAKEDEARRARAAEAAAFEAEKERVRAQRRAENPDGIVGNASKKKRERKEREEQAAARRRYEAEQRGEDPDAKPEIDMEKCPSGIPERPYCKGRSYDPDRYSKKN